MLRVFVQTKIIGTLPQDMVHKEGLDQDWTKLFSLVDSAHLSSAASKISGREKLKTHFISAVCLRSDRVETGANYEYQKRFFDSLVVGRSRLGDGLTNKNFVLELVEGSKDILGTVLNEKVRVNGLLRLAAAQPASSSIRKQ